MVKSNEPRGRRRSSGLGEEGERCPRTKRGRETRARILAAAAELMHVQGVHGTSVDNVLDRSRAGKGQFYHYFQNKDDLVRQVLRRQLARGIERDLPFLERLDTWRGIEAWFRRIVRAQENSGFVGGCPLGSLAAEMADQDEELRVELTDAFELKKAWLSDGLETMKERGRLSDEADPGELAEFVLATLQGGLLLSTTRKDAGPLRTALDEALEHLRSFAVEDA